MNILVISRGIPTQKDAQWGSFEYDQAKALVALGHTVSMVSVDSRFRWYRRRLGLRYEEREGVRLYNYFLCPDAISGLFGNGFKEAVIRYQWRKIESALLKRGEKIDIIYSHFLFNTFYAVTALKNIHAPIVAIEHWSDINKEPLPDAVRTLGEATYPNVDHVITVSKSLQQRLKQLFNVDAKVLYNMVGDEFQYTPTSPHTKVRFISTGSLMYRKGFDLLIRAFSQLGLPMEKWDLTIIGEGKIRSQLQEQIDNADLHESIHLVGLKTKDEIARMLNESDVFVLPSRNENFSVAVLEALACGLPVIASICGGIRECIDEKNGMLFEVDDVDGLAHCIQTMYDHHEEYNRSEIANDCKARFSSEVIAKQLTDIFDEVLAK